MRTALAEAWQSRVEQQAAESLERLAAQANLAQSLMHQGKHSKAEPMLRELHSVHMRLFGAEHQGTLTVANNLAGSLSHQGKYTDAEQIHQVLGVQTRVLGPEHPDTLRSANTLCYTLHSQGEYADAEGSSARCFKRERACSGRSMKRR
jgi:hypothetical protein